MYHRIPSGSMVGTQKAKERLGPERKIGRKKKRVGEEKLEKCVDKMFVTDRYDTLCNMA